MRSSWAAGSGWSYYGQNKDEGNAAYVRAMGTFELPLARWIWIKADPQLNLYSSRVQARYDDESYESGVRILDGYVGVKPIQVIELHLGIIGQNHLRQPMLLSSQRSFPGVTEIATYRAWKVQLEQVVPTSSSLDSERVDKEKLPRLTTASIEATTRVLKTADWTVWGGRFQWSGLPSKVAQESKLWGNSVNGEVAPGAFFVSQFHGWQAGTKLCVCGNESPVGALFEFNRIRNVAAPSGLNDAQSFGLGPQIVMGDRTLEILYRRFFIEKDAAIAIYNSSAYGTNRIGDEVELKYTLKDHGFSIVGGWLNSLTLRDNADQATLTAFSLGLETQYVPF
jgi:hypothetical protein